MRVLILDNYDSFTFNLYQQVGQILVSQGHTVMTADPEAKHWVLVRRNDEIDISGIQALNPDCIIISPGPGTPEDANYFGICHETILKFGQRLPILGVCLGMQGIAHCFGGRIVTAKVPMHGKTSLIQHDNKGIFQDIPQSPEVMRYHSLIVETASLPDCLEITAVIQNTEDTSSSLPSRAASGSEIMGIRHKTLPIEGVQFHPESFATEAANRMLANFLESARSEAAAH